MVAFMGFVFAAQTTGKGPLAALSTHLSDPAHNNWTTNIGNCVLPSSVEVSAGVSIPLICLWPGQ
jgi:light-harvesting complex I chlorophyll a/b binding protein 4